MPPESLEEMMRRREQERRQAPVDDVPQGVSGATGGPGYVVFENPANGYREEFSKSCSLWVFLFGFFYLLTQALWVDALIWLVVTVVAFSVLGDGGMVVIFALSLWYASRMQNILRAKYLKRGWVLVSDGTQPDAKPAPADRAKG